MFRTFCIATPALRSILASILILSACKTEKRVEPEVARTAPAAGPITRPCPECMSDIPMAARRCAFCTSPVAPVA